MPSYSHNRKTIGYCDRCSWEYPLSSLRKESVNGKRQSFKVCPPCFDGDHPQNFIGKRGAEDNQALMISRPDSGLEDSRNGNTIIYDFTDNITGWTTNGGSTLTHDSSNGWMNHTWTGTDPQFYFYTASFSSTTYTRVRARLQVSSRSDLSEYAGYDFFWGAGSFSGDRRVRVSEPPQNMGDPFFELLWDMEDDDDWTGTITSLRFDFYGTAASIGSGIDIDWIRIEEKII